ncbi:RNA polymerase sigma factor [Teredinibacter turnerae]|uniref:RNA polymerase sigma factor n=1 Tax=Teredinibacter turnerae TaxID=2426 RepID=UPI0006974535|nr:sigma factor [Teredinibacter turnerae]
MRSSVNNAKAFEQVFADYKAMIFKIARSYTTNAEVTHDLVQEITLQQWVGFEQYDAQYKPRVDLSDRTEYRNFPAAQNQPAYISLAMKSAKLISGTGKHRHCPKGNVNH